MVRRKVRAAVQVVAWDELGRSREVQFGAAVGGAPERSHGLTASAAARIYSLIGPPSAPPLLHSGGTVLFTVALEPAPPVASSGVPEKPRGSKGSQGGSCEDHRILGMSWGSTPAP